jgi:hypothetical protein
VRARKHLDCLLSLRLALDGDVAGLPQLAPGLIFEALNGRFRRADFVPHLRAFLLGQERRGIVGLVARTGPIVLFGWSVAFVAAFDAAAGPLKISEKTVGNVRHEEVPSFDSKG